MKVNLNFFHFFFFACCHEENQLVLLIDLVFYSVLKKSGIMDLKLLLH